MAKVEESFGKITGIVIQGRKLAPKDPNGLSDPFVECGGIDKKGEFLSADKKENKTTKSKVVRKTLAPVWRLSFDIPVHRRTKGFKVQVWDWDYIGSSDFMGEVTVFLSDMQSGKEIEGWFTLKNRPSKPKENVSGEIFMRYTYFKDGATIPNVSEEERSLLEDTRAGNISIVWTAIEKQPNSLIVQSSGLPNLFKWAATSSVKERVEFLNQRKGKLFEHLSKAATTFPNDAKVVFYSLGALTFFSKLAESKALFMEDHVKFIVKQLQEPPSVLSEADLPLHISNLLIIFANICTFKFHSQYRAEVARCQELLLQHGAIQATLNCLKNYEKHETVRRSALSVLLKVERANDKVKETFKTLGVHDEMIKVIRRTKNVMLKWLATTVLETFVRSENKAYAEAVLAVPSCVRYLNQFTDAEGPHPASLNTGIVYLLEAMLPYLTDQFKDEIVEEKTMISGIIKSFNSYRKYVPKENQGPQLAERLLRLLHSLALHQGCRAQMRGELESIVDIVAKNCKLNSVAKTALPLFEFFASQPETSEELKMTNLSHAISLLDRDVAKLYDKLKEKLVF